jgi:hypothetical protein
MSRRNKDYSDLKVKGFITCQVYDTKQKRIVGRREMHNLVVNGGRDHLALLAGAGTDPISYGHVGSSTSAPAASQTDLLAELTSSPGRKSVSSSTAATGTVQFTWSYETNEFTDSSNNVFGEVGLFNSVSGGTMVSRATYAQTTKDSNMQVSFTYQLRFGT